MLRGKWRLQGAGAALAAVREGQSSAVTLRGMKGAGPASSWARVGGRGTARWDDGEVAGFPQWAAGPLAPGAQRREEHSTERSTDEI